jgi:hypothetical protein
MAGLVRALAEHVWKDQIETIEAVNEALAEEGEGRPAAEVHAELRKKHFGVPRPVPKARRT